MSISASIQLSTLKVFSLSDLVKGKTFEFDGNREDFDSELYDQLDEEEIEQINEESTKLNPWQHKFDELIMQMFRVEEGVYKKILKEGIENRAIPEVSMVKIHYNAYLEGQANAFDSTYMRGSPLTFTLGKGTVLQGIETAIRSMKVEEESLFIISWKLLYGKIGCAPRIPARADALFNIRILETREIALPPHLNNLNDFYQRYHEALMMDTTAKRAFKKDNIQLAINNYKRAVHELEFAKVTTDEEDKVYNEFMRKVLLNLAVCYNKEKKPRQVLKMIEKMRNLESIDRNPKALYQEGKAFTTLGEFQKARTALSLASKLAPDDENITAALQSLEVQMMEDKKAKRIFAQNALRAQSAPSHQENVKRNTQKLNENTRRQMKELLEPFVEGHTFSMHLPNDLIEQEVNCLKSLEEEMNVKLVISNTSLGPDYKIMKNLPKKPLLEEKIEEKEEEEHSTE